MSVLLYVTAGTRECTYGSSKHDDEQIVKTKNRNKMKTTLLIFLSDDGCEAGSQQTGPWVTPLQTFRPNNSHLLPPDLACNGGFLKETNDQTGFYIESTENDCVYQISRVY